MPNQLRDIRKFPDLVRYLETELDWPVEAGSFDDLTFEYQPAELGLKEEEAVAIKKIHQLRPLAAGGLKWTRITKAIEGTRKRVQERGARNPKE